MFAFFPFFSHMSIPVVVKTSLTIFMTVFLFPLATAPDFELTVSSLFLALVSELFLGFIAGVILSIVFAALQLAGMMVSFIMGFTMASVMDPQTGTSMPLVSQMLSLIALVMLLAFNGHHGLILFINQSLEIIPFGTFYPTENIWTYLVEAVSGMFVYGFILAFPVVGMALLADVVFGMLMKTMPQFNMLVVGFPIRILEALLILMAVLSAIMLIFKREFLEAINMLKILFVS